MTSLGGYFLPSIMTSYFMEGISSNCSLSIFLTAARICSRVISFGLNGINQPQRSSPTCFPGSYSEFPAILNEILPRINPQIVLAVTKMHLKRSSECGSGWSGERGRAGSGTEIDYGYVKRGK